MESKYLIDTNVIIDFSSGKLPKNGHDFVANLIDKSPHISFINKIELLGFSIVPQSIVLFCEAAETIGISEDIINRTIEIRKNYKIKLPDAIIGATCLVHNLVIVTRNEADFKKIPNLKIANPHHH